MTQRRNCIKRKNDLGEVKRNCIKSRNDLGEVKRLGEPNCVKDHATTKCSGLLR